MPPIFSNIQDRFIRALTLHQSGHFDQAEALYREVLQYNPNTWEPWHNLGILLRQRGRLDEAIACYRRAVQIKPDFAPFYNEIGENYRLQGLANEALEAFDQALALDPAYLTVMNNRGLALHLLGRLTDAIHAWQSVADILTGNPNQPLSSSTVTGSPPREALLGAAYINLGNAHHELGQHANALRFHRLAFEIQPHNHVAYSNWLRDHASLSDAPPDLPAFHEWWTRYTAGITRIAHPPGQDPDKLLRIGFVSGDFRRHSIIFFLQGLFDHFDCTRFAFICYSNVPQPDEFTAQLQAKATHWRNIVGLPDQAVAAQIQADHIDILIDLAGHTADNRLRLFAHKPAPIQVTYLGSPITNGAPGNLFDYRITDTVADPPGTTEAYFTEKLWRLPRPAWCYRPPITRSPDRQITRSPFTFGSFNSFTKITPDLLALWIRILQDAPNTRLVLKALSFGDDPFRQSLINRFSAADIASDRLTLLARFPKLDDHLAAYNQVDLALDTFPYHGTTTTCESLWMNVPVLTLAGNSHHSRVGVSLLTGVGLTDLIAKTPDEYHAAAVRLATHPTEIQSLRHNLRARLQQSPLMDEQNFTTEFTTALRQMWQVHCQHKV